MKRLIAFIFLFLFSAHNVYCDQSVDEISQMQDELKNAKSDFNLFIDDPKIIESSKTLRTVTYYINMEKDDFEKMKETFKLFSSKIGEFNGGVIIDNYKDLYEFSTLTSCSLSFSDSLKTIVFEDLQSKKCFYFDDLKNSKTIDVLDYITSKISIPECVLNKEIENYAKSLVSDVMKKFELDPLDKYINDFILYSYEKAYDHKNIGCVK